MLEGNMIYPLSQDDQWNRVCMLVHEAHTPILWTSPLHHLRLSVKVRQDLVLDVSKSGSAKP
jgi:hypothetical protein